MVFLPVSTFAGFAWFAGLPEWLNLTADHLESVIGLVRESAQFLLALAAVIASIRSEKRAKSAEASAAVAHERATEAAREQLTFALKRAVHSHGFTLSSSLPPKEGGAA